MKRYDVFGNKYNDELLGMYGLLLIELRKKLEGRQNVVIDVAKMEAGFQKKDSK